MSKLISRNFAFASLAILGVSSVVSIAGFFQADSVVAQTPETALFCNPTSTNPLRGFLDPLEGNGRYSNGHKDTVQKFADDLTTPIGTQFKAMRSGRVIELQKNVADFKKGQQGNKDNQYSVNYILIEHDQDVNCGGKPYRSLYLHVKQNSAKVNVGDRVTMGQIIGETGHNGWTTGPHLHAEINRATGPRSLWYQRQTVPSVWSNNRNK
jgi:murein DD-endopeptidase MepM/ murein hydrolase activator NlpD